MKVTDFAITTNDENCLYVYQTTDKRTKNHQDDNERKLVRMHYDYFSDDDDCCPAKTIFENQLRHQSVCFLSLNVNFLV